MGHVVHIMCHVSFVTCLVSPVTCHLSLTPTATEPPHANSCRMHSKLLAKTNKPENFENAKNH